MTFCDKPVQSMDHVSQVFEAALCLRRNRAQIPEADLQQFQCQICQQTFTSMALLRRHWTTAHEHRPGQLRPYKVTDSVTGVPTCARCDMQFTTWTSLQYHVRFVCTDSRQEDDDPERRLRVREFLQYIYAMNYVALGLKPHVDHLFSSEMHYLWSICVQRSGPSDALGT